MNRDEKMTEARTFKLLRINLASPDDIVSWSYGEVTKPETINYRRLRPEKDGLFCEAIFGPTRDYQCYCGKYKGIRYRGIICDKCGVEVTRSSVRRERLGHITLAAPVAHVWYTRRVPSHLSVLLDITKRNLDRVLYFAQYIVVSVDEEARQRALKRLDDEQRSRVAAMGEAAQARINELQGNLAQEKEQAAAEKGAVKTRFEDELNTRTETILAEARTLQERLDGMKGITISNPIIFTPTDTVIVDVDELVERKHYTLLNKVAQDALDVLEQEIRRREAEALGDAPENGADLQTAQEDVRAVRDELHGRTSAIISHYDAERDEILSLAPLQFFNESRYRELRQKWGQVFRAGMGAEAVHEILERIDLDKLSEELWREVRQGRSAQRRKKATRRLRVIEALRKSGNRPEWMILTVLPVLPPELRPMVQLDGGRFATSDLNDLYRRVINRNNRLQRLLDLGAPEVIIHNEKRMLQEAVDSLIDNSQRGKAMSRRGRRQLRSLSDMLKGKKGRFRRNLLGKRVDYSGRSVIVVGPHLKMHQCGLPKTMALELYRPFVIQRLVEYNFATNVKAAKRLIERERPEVWEVLDEVIGSRPVLLNRAPTLHRLGIQAFEPILVEGKAIQLHPLVCSAFNADFDGDQMAVHIPLSRKAVEEARKLMLASRNVLKPADGQPIIGPSKDMCMGIYYMTMDGAPGAKGAGKVLADLDEAEMVYALGLVDIHAVVKVAQVYDDGRPLPEEPVETTIGRALFNRIVPNELRYINEPMDKGALQDLIGLCYRTLDSDATVQLADDIKRIGFEYATRSGVTISVYDLTVPDEKNEIIAEATRSVTEIERQYRRGLLTEEEQYNRTIEIWSRARDQVSKAVRQRMDPYGPIAVMANSGASKGGFGPIAQLSGMRGLMADPSGRIIPLPIRSNLREGLTALEYFISTHGSRKGLADTALRTADAGYLTRRLVDTAQDVIVNSIECGTRRGLWLRRSDDIGGQTMAERTLGRYAAAPIVNPQTGEVIVNRNDEIDEIKAKMLDTLGIDEVYVRSPMTCDLEFGICAKCYGRDLGRGGLVGVGTAVGIIAAQSIGEPGTQLTLRTFHTGGTASSGGDITSGLPRVEELLEARKEPKGEAEISDISGVVHIYREGDENKLVVVDSQIKKVSYDIPDEWEILVEDGDEVQLNDILARDAETHELRAKAKGRISREERDLILIYEVREEHDYLVPVSTRLLVAEGQQIQAGTQLCEGVPNPHRILQVQGRDAVQVYLLREIQEVYRSQGVNIHDKHFEIIIRKMLSRVLVTDPGDTFMLPGDVVDRIYLEKINHEMVEKGQQPARARQVLLGITKAALATDSFLSAASFQHTIKVLSNAAVEGMEDPLFGLKENVIIGKLIPAGTGYRGDIRGSDGPIEEYEGVLIEKDLPKGTLLGEDGEDTDAFMLSDLERPYP